MKKLTPLITVDAIEPCLDFWTQRLGFEVTATVPHGDGLGFAMLNHGAVQVMYQSLDSVRDDAPEILEHVSGRTPLFVEVEALDPVIAALGEGAEVVVPRRTTFYGMDEIFVRAPCGTVVGFAARVDDTD